MRDPVSLYLWRLSCEPDALSHLSGFLSAEERARADRFVRPSDAEAYRVGRGRMRQILAEWIGTDPAALSFITDAWGKPFLTPGPAFNLSHAGGVACLAVHPTQALGVDIEAPRAVEHAVAERFFSPAEVAALAALPAADWLGGFFRCWTRKEAVVKATGQGMGADLSAFDVTLAPDAPPRLLRMGDCAAPDWAMAHLDLTPGLVGAIAVPRTTWPLQVDVRLCPPDLSVQVST